MPQAQERTQVRSLPLLTRAVPVTSVDEAARTFRTCWSTGAQVRRFDWWTGRYYLEELSLDPKAVRLDRMNGGAPLLNSHQQWDLRSVLGVTEKAWLDKGEGLSDVRFSDRDDEVNAFWRDVVNGIIRNISSGYIVHRFVKHDPEQEGGLARWVAEDWEPVEQSLVPVGADALAGVRSLLQGSEPPTQDQLLEAAARAVGNRTYPCEFVELAGSRVLVPGASLDPTPAAAAAPTPEGEPSMTDKTRAAADDQAANTGGQQQQAAAPAPATPTADQVRTEERTRIAGIHAAVAAFRRTAHGNTVSDADVAGMIERGITIDAARAEMFAKLEAASTAAGPTRGAANITTERDEQQQRRLDMANAVAHRANPGAVKLEEGARRFRGFTLRELARASLEAQGVCTEGMGPIELVGLAMGNTDAQGFRSLHGVSDFSIALASTVNRSLRSAYESAGRSFTRWARRGTLNDFRAATRVAVAGNLTLEKVNEFGEFKRGKIENAGETIQLATYGKVVGVTRQAVINDDLDFLSRLPAMFGRAAADFESDTVYGVLTGTSTMSDGQPLFHASHGNLAGAGAAITATSLNEARKALRTQKDPSGNNQPLNLVGKYVIVGADKELEAQQMFQAVIVATKTTDANVFRDAYEVVVEPRITGNQWYLAADSAVIDTIEYAYLDGNEGLYTEERMGFDVDGLEVKARLDFAAKPIDWRGLWKNPGA